MKQWSFKGIEYVTIIAAFLVVGCSPQQKISSQTTQKSEDIFSNRPIGPVKTVAIVTLSEPALLKVAKKTSSGWVIPPAAKAKLEEQQRQVESHIKKISTEAYVLYRYKMILNGLAVVIRSDLLAQINVLPGIQKAVLANPMERPLVKAISDTAKVTGEVNSVNFIGAEQVHQELGLTGKGMRIGVIDTGVDYTHSMLGGTGKVEDFKAVDPKSRTPLFPNRKVVGGYDFVGSDFNSGSPLEANSIPQPDENPIDEAGHGSHVSGTIAGIGDGINTYSGVAPDAEIYALKVFGKEGSTNDSSVIAALEFAADPNGDSNPDDQLDAVNLSLGGGFGQPQILYNEAVSTLSDSGTAVIASAGNSGNNKDYIVGAPGTSDKAFSIAASVDGSEFNWKFRAVRFISPNNSNWLVKAIESEISKPIAEAGDVQGELVDIGLGNKPLSDELKAKLKGNVALISRGEITFVAKLKFAEENGAVGAIVANNVSGKPAAMGGTERVGIPAIPVTMELGAKLKQEMAQGAVRIQFLTDESILETDNIDTITDFSSKGPRSEDNLLKPEIAAPGKSILSAKMGGGAEGARMDGTSMSAPHMAGVVALIKQAHPTLSSDEIKAVIMNTAKIISNRNVTYPFSVQGAGRVQTYESAKAKIVVTPGGVSLGLIQVDNLKSLTKTVVVRNISSQNLQLQISTQGQLGLNISGPTSVALKSNEAKQLKFKFEVIGTAEPLKPIELNGIIRLSEGDAVLAQVPVLAIQKRLTQVGITGIQNTPSQLKVNFANKGQTTGLALMFNLLGRDNRKEKAPKFQQWRTRSCDLESAGYRITTRDGKDYLQVAFKLYKTVTTWNICDLSVLVDSDGDGEADQELASINNANQLATAENGSLQFGSLLLDAKKAREIRLKFETALQSGKVESLDYKPAQIEVGTMAPFPQSPLAVLETPLDKLQRGKDGKIHLRVAATALDNDAIEMDDYLGTGLGNWIAISDKKTDQRVFDMPDILFLPPNGKNAIAANKGTGKMTVVTYYPDNSYDAKNPTQDFGSDFIP